MKEVDARIIAMYDVENIFDLIDEKLSNSYQKNEEMSFELKDGRQCIFTCAGRTIQFDIPAIYLDILYESFLNGVIEHYLPNENYRVSQLRVVKMGSSRVWRGIEIKTSEGATISIEMPKISMKLCKKYKEAYRDYIVSIENNNKITI